MTAHQIFLRIYFLLTLHFCFFFPYFVKRLFSIKKTIFFFPCCDLQDQKTLSPHFIFISLFFCLLYIIWYTWSSSSIDSTKYKNTTLENYEFDLVPATLPAITFGFWSFIKKIVLFIYLFTFFQRKLFFGIFVSTLNFNGNFNPSCKEQKKTDQKKKKKKKTLQREKQKTFYQ